MYFTPFELIEPMHFAKSRMPALMASFEPSATAAERAGLPYAAAWYLMVGRTLNRGVTADGGFHTRSGSALTRILGEQCPKLGMPKLTVPPALQQSLAIGSVFNGCALEVVPPGTSGAWTISLVGPKPEVQLQLVSNSGRFQQRVAARPSQDAAEQAAERARVEAAAESAANARLLANAARAAAIDARIYGKGNSTSNTIESTGDYQRRHENAARRAEADVDVADADARAARSGQRRASASAQSNEEPMEWVSYPIEEQHWFGTIKTTVSVTGAPVPFSASFETKLDQTLAKHDEVRDSQGLLKEVAVDRHVKSARDLSFDGRAELLRAGSAAMSFITGQVRSGAEKAVSDRVAALQDPRLRALELLSYNRVNFPSPERPMLGAEDCAFITCAAP